MVMSCSPNITGWFLGRGHTEHNYFSNLVLMLFFSLSLPTLPPTTATTTHFHNLRRLQTHFLVDQANIFKSWKCYSWMKVGMCLRNITFYLFYRGEVALRARNKRSALGNFIRVLFFVVKYSSCCGSLLQGRGRWGEDRRPWPYPGA